MEVNRKVSKEAAAVQSAVLRDILINVRMTAQLTQSELAEKIGKPQSYVSKYESGERKLSFVEVREIALGCGQDFVEFVALYENEIQMVDQ